jgi:hypothetical protein
MEALKVPTQSVSVATAKAMEHTGSPTLKSSWLLEAFS